MTKSMNSDRNLSAFQVESTVEVELAVLRVVEDVARLRQTLEDHGMCFH